MSAGRILKPAALAFFLGAGAQAEPPANLAPAPRQPEDMHARITKAVLAKLPKYLPPAPAKLPDFSSPDDSGAAADDLLHLPKMTVRPVAPESAPDFAFLNAKGRAELAMKANPGLHFGNIFGLNSGPNGPALAIQADEREAQRKAAATEMVDRTTIVAGAEAKKIRQLLEAAVQRANSDWLTAKGGKPQRP